MNRLQQIANMRQGLIGQGDLAKRVTAIREDSVANLTALTVMATQMLEQKLAKVYPVKNSAEAATVLSNLLKGEKQVARSYSNALAEIGFDNMMAEQGIAVQPTRLEEIVRQEMKLSSSGHPHLVTLDQTNDVIENGLKRFTGRQGQVAPAELVRLAHEKVKESILQCEYGITGANCVVAENGVLVMAEDEGNVRAVSNLPYKHVVVVGLDKIILSAEDALSVIQATAIYGVGRITPTYYSLIAGPSRTADIEFRMAYGMHGPKEVHIVLLDNGRTAIREQGAVSLLKCINCGSCCESCAALASQQGWADVVFSPKEIALGIVQGKVAALIGQPSMADFLCPVGLSAMTVINGLRKIGPM